MTIYLFKKEDGTQIEKFFPIGKCPDEIICEDGVKAHRVFTSPNITWGKGVLPPSASMRRKKDMIKRNKDADKRMRERWKSCKK